MKLIYTLLRIAEKRKYLEEMQGGHLRLKTLGSYLRYEGEGDKARGDEDEGLAAIFQPSRVRLYFGAQEITDIFGPIKIRTGEMHKDHILCMYAIHAGRWATEPIESPEKFVKSLEVKDDNRQFGNFILFTLNTQEFLDRIAVALKIQGFTATLGPVEYVDEQTYNGKIPREKRGFVKKSKFSYQNEYRLYVINHDNTPEIRHIDVGDLSDITAITTFDDFKKDFKVEFTEG